MAKVRKYRRGERFYRFKVDLTDGSVTKDVYEVLDTIGVTTKMILLSHNGKTPPKDTFAHYNLGESLGAIKTKATVKYVLLDKDDEEFAKGLVLGYLVERYHEREAELCKMREWIMALGGAL